MDRASGQDRTRSRGDDRDRSFTYGEMAGRIRRLASGLRRLGVARGDRVAWLGPNHPVFLESLFAAGLLGAALAPVNHRLEAAEILSVVMSEEAEATEQGLLAFCRLHLAPHQVPASVTVVDRLPRNSVGKLIRSQLRELARPT